MTIRTARSLNRRARISACAVGSEGLKATGRPKGDIMHPMFVKLYLETEADDEEEKRRRASRARRLRSRATVQVTARDRDRQPRR